MTCTYYHDATNRPCANGKTYRENRRIYGYFCASNRYGLGSRVLVSRLTIPGVSRGGQRVRVVVVDRIGRGTDIDLDTAAFRSLAGTRWRIIGRLPVRVRLVATGHAMKCVKKRRLRKAR